MLNKFLLFFTVFRLLLGANQSLAVTCPDTTNWDASSGVCIPTNTGISDNTVDSVLENVMNWLLIVIGIIAVIAFVISGMQYLLSGGDQNMIETAKRNMKWSIVGVVVALMGYVIIQAVDTMLNGGSDF